MMHLDPDTIYVNHFGTARIGSICDADLRLKAEAEGITHLKAQAMPPADCGSDIIAAPGRGPMMRFRPRRVEMTPSGPRSRHDGYQMRSGARIADAFDLMTLNCHRAYERQCAIARSQGKAIPAYRAPFTVGQVEIGREYAALAERCSAAGVKCASLEALRQASSGGGDREEAILADFQRLRYFERRIGDGLAKAVRRIRPGRPTTKEEAAAKRVTVSRQRRAIFDQALVDGVCIGGMSLTDVLKAYGWGVDQKAREALRQSLCAALDRMQGFKMVGAQDGS
jgi:hypothetical protein